MQLLKFDDGELRVLNSLGLGGGARIHKTVDGGFWFSPRQPLMDESIAGSLGEPYASEALAWIADRGWEPKQVSASVVEEAVVDESSNSSENESAPAEVTSSRRRRRDG